MADIITRLRDRAYAFKAVDKLCEEAADEIKRLDSCLKLAMRQAGWLSTADSPPTEAGRYIAWDGHSPWYYCEYDGQFLVSEGYPPITHWMPDSADNLDMRLEAVPDRLAQEVRLELARLRWKAKTSESAAKHAAQKNRATPEPYEKSDKNRVFSHTSRATLTDEEREAVEAMAQWCEVDSCLCAEQADAREADHYAARAATLRGLLERLGGVE